MRAQRPKFRNVVAHLRFVRPDIHDPVDAIAARSVIVDGRIVTNANALVPIGAAVTLIASRPLRGEDKLRAALDAFGVDVAGRRCVDLGAVAQLETLRLAADADLVAFVKPMYGLHLHAPPQHERTFRRAVLHAVRSIESLPCASPPRCARRWSVRAGLASGSCTPDASRLANEVATAVELLATQMTETYDRLLGRLNGLTDEEFFWEPAPGCWRVFRGEDGRWTYDYEEPDPVPAPLTTIGWRLVHVALCKVIYHEWAFGPRRLDFVTIENPHDVAGSIEMLGRGQALLADDLANLRDADLDRDVLTNWGEEWPAWRIFWTMIDHDAHHGGEIGALRDLYRVRLGR